MAEKRKAQTVGKKKASSAAKSPKAKTAIPSSKTSKQTPASQKISAKSKSKPTVTKLPPASPKPEKAKPVFQEEKFPRVQVIKKAEVLKRQAQEAARESIKPAEPEEAELPKAPPSSMPALRKEAPLAKVKPESHEREFEDREKKHKIQDMGMDSKSSPFVKASSVFKRKPSPPPMPPVEKPRLEPPVVPPKPAGAPEHPATVKEEKISEPVTASATGKAVAVSETPVVVAEAEELPKELAPINVSFPVSVGELAPKLNKTPNELIKHLLQKGILATINQRLDEDLAKKIAADLGFELAVMDPLDLKIQEQDEMDDPAQLQTRPPVVTVMGHVDHGKTSLLDAIREKNVTASEEGGITQRIGAYQVELKGRRITFLDTPGHEAFTSMRARGTKVTDVAVLVVAADDGVMPQTLEALDHARAANVPVVVAINKVDKPNANVDHVKQQLSEQGLIPEEWGGNTVFVSVSAKQNTGIADLLEMILLVSDLADLKANPIKAARGTIIEGKLDRGRGPVATVLVQEGTFRLGDAFVVGNTYGKLRALTNDHGGKISAATPSLPVEIVGLNDVPEAGDVLQVVADDKIARQIADARLLRSREQTLASLKRVTLDDLYQQIQQGEIKDLNMILKADAQGSVEALKDSLERLSTDEVRVRVVHAGVGNITESDVMLAATSNAIIIGYNIRPDPHIKNVAEREKVDLRLYRIIYQAIEDITQAMVGLRKPELRETFQGRAEVLQIFKIGKLGTIAGCRVTDGKIARDANVRLIRDGALIYEGKLASLKRFKDDVRDVAQGYECGMSIEKFNDVKVGDVMEAYVIEEVRQTTLGPPQRSGSQSSLQETASSSIGGKGKAQE